MPYKLLVSEVLHAFEIFVMNKLILYARLVKFEHTIFAMPFALIGFFMAVMVTDQVPFWKLLAEIIACMVFARNAAMGFNRFLDRKFDAANPRTALREIPEIGRAHV